MYNWLKWKKAFFDKTHRQKEPQYSIKKGTKINASMIMMFWSIFAVAVSVWLINGSIHVGAKALQENYQTAYNAEKDNTYHSFYDRYFAKAEEAYHVSNEVAISISDLQKKNDLEVLQVSDVEYIIEDKQDNRKGITVNCTPCQGQIEFVGPRLLDSLKVGNTSKSDKPTTRYPHDGQDPFAGIYVTALTWQDVFSYWGLQQASALQGRVLPESFQ